MPTFTFQTNSLYREDFQLVLRTRGKCVLANALLRGMTDFARGICIDIAPFEQVIETTGAISAITIAFEQ